jgi:hypothetical protein
MYLHPHLFDLCHLSTLSFLFFSFFSFVETKKHFSPIRLEIWIQSAKPHKSWRDLRAIVYMHVARKKQTAPLRVRAKK